MMGALNICKQLGVAESEFFIAMASFKGASRRLEKIFERCPRISNRLHVGKYRETAAY